MRHCYAERPVALNTVVVSRVSACACISPAITPLTRVCPYPLAQARGAAPAARPKARRGYNSDDDSEEEEEEESDSDDSAPRRRDKKRKGKGFEITRRSERGNFGFGRSVYKEPSEEDDELVESDEERDALAARRQYESYAPEPQASIVEKLLSQREVTDEQEGAAEGRGSGMEYLAKLRGK